jgi:hypothetical protein
LTPVSDTLLSHVIFHLASYQNVELLERDLIEEILFLFWSPLFFLCLEKLCWHSDDGFTLVLTEVDEK